MDVSYELEGITFTWDSLKAEENLQKHGVSFETAAEALLDPLVQVAEVRQEAGRSGRPSWASRGLGNFYSSSPYSVALRFVCFRRGK